MNIKNPAEAIAWLKTVRHFNCASVIGIIESSMAREEILKGQLHLLEGSGEHVESHLEKQADILRIDLESSRGREAALREETACLKAVLSGMEFQNVDGMVSDGVDACIFLGQQSARIIKGIQAERDRLREELDKVCGDEWRKDKRQIDALQQRLTVAEQSLTERNEFIKELIDEAGYDWLSSNAVEKMKAFIITIKPSAEPERCFHCNQPGGQCCASAGVKP